MRILIDTNVLIPLEPTSHENLEPGSRVAAQLVRAINDDHNHRLLIHPSSLRDLARDSDVDRASSRQILIGKYSQLMQAPLLSLVEPQLGIVPVDSHDWVDHCLLAAIVGDAVDILVTQDGMMHKKAARLGVLERVLYVEDALALLKILDTKAPLPPPAVDFIPVHAINGDDPIFDSLRPDYPGFDNWLTRVKRAGRRGWLVTSEDGTYAAVCIIKEEDDDFRLGGKVLKISTLKVSSEFQGNRYGELLFKAVFDFCRQNSYVHVYVTVFEKHASLISLLTQFGFWHLDGTRTSLGEMVFVKDFVPSASDVSSMTPLQLHVRFGPPALRLRSGNAFLVPIQPKFHRLLFPDAEAQQSLALMPRPYGNALRKAYLSRSPSRLVTPGSVLLFYRSHISQGVTAVGVVEETFVSQDVDEIVARVGQRTVYSREEIHGLAVSPVLAILLRQDRLLEHPISLEELIVYNAAEAAPQSITSVDDDALEWLSQRLGESCFYP